ncbi:MAG TPA: hypothetical protein VG897_04095 [Terriglobales bacterium]|nr:hypothetical protein [Terriglobales bacterium]
MTIIDAVKQVMRANGMPMTAKDAYDAIVSAKLYEFHAQNPAHVVLMQIRRHSEGIDFPTAAQTKHFKLVGENRFFPLDQPIRLPRKPRTPKPSGLHASGKFRSLATSLREIQSLHERYVTQLKEELSQICAVFHQLHSRRSRRNCSTSMDLRTPT